MARAVADLKTPRRMRAPRLVLIDAETEDLLIQHAPHLRLMDESTDIDPREAQIRQRRRAPSPAPLKAASHGPTKIHWAVAMSLLTGWCLQQALVTMPVEATPALASDIRPSNATSGQIGKNLTGSRDFPIIARAVTSAQIVQTDSRRNAIAPNSGGLIQHAPSVSAATIRRILRSYGSLAAYARYADGKDAANYVWDEGRVLGIDPAVIMGIFYHESHYGTMGMATLTNSVGNIRPLDGQPQLNGYRKYASWQQGFDACYSLLLSYARHGAPSVSVAIPVWAPPADNNNDSAYIGSVMSTMQALYAQSRS